MGVADRADVIHRLRGLDDGVRVYVSVGGAIFALSDEKVRGHPNDAMGVIFEVVSSLSEITKAQRGSA